MKFLILALALFAVGCGSSDGRDGRDGKDGVQCSGQGVDEGVKWTCNDGKEFLVKHGGKGERGYRGSKGAKGDAGKAGPEGPQGSQGEAGERGKDAIVSNYSCEYKASDETVVTWSGVGFLSGDSFASMKRVFKKGEFMSSKYVAAMFAEGEDIELTDNVYSTYYYGECKGAVAVRKQEGAELFPVDCKCGGAS